MFGRSKRHIDPYPADGGFTSRADRLASEAERPEGASRGGSASSLGGASAGAGSLPGREAESPADIPKAGWKQIVTRAYKETKDDNVPLLAAGVAFYAFLAIFPALIAGVTLYGIFADPTVLQRQVEKITNTLPGGAGGLLAEPMKAAAGHTGFSVTALVGLLGALWAASGGMQNLIKAINLAYDEKETRKFVKLRTRAVVLAVGAVVFFAVTIGLIAVLPAVLKAIGAGGIATLLANIARWVGLFVFVTFALATVYRYGPDRDQPKFRWVSIGSVAATLLWLIGSALFAVYVAMLGHNSYLKTYGTLAGVVALLMWLYLTAYIVLFGAEVNAEMEHQTARDTTKGPERPMGTRQAEMADTLPDGDRAGADVR